RFATGSISLLGEFCQAISCGCESEDISLLEEVAELLCDHTVKEKIFDRVKAGEAYAVAIERVLGDYHKSYAEQIRRPNNILACEYIKAIRNLGLSIPLIPVTRRGAEHNSEQIDGSFASASLIRSLPVCQVDDYLPGESAMILKRESEAGRIIRGAPEVAMLSYLRRLTPGEIAGIAGCGEGLENRVYEVLRTETSLAGVIERITTKRYPAARIRRLLLSAYLDITSKLAENCLLPPYIRVLALTIPEGRSLPSIKKAMAGPY
ncbi:MAG: nucleotidyltransferase family protein, partial [Clostridia bacterium]|nr:nucleotidyltransferase family protein [Clostridia bacterium]